MQDFVRQKARSLKDCPSKTAAVSRKNLVCRFLLPQATAKNAAATNLFMNVFSFRYLR